MALMPHSLRYLTLLYRLLVHLDHHMCSCSCLHKTYPQICYPPRFGTDECAKSPATDMVSM